LLAWGLLELRLLLLMVVLLRLVLLVVSPTEDVVAAAGVGAERSPAVINEMSRRAKARWRSDDAAALAGR
jgi:hypothetical protein